MRNASGFSSELSDQSQLYRREKKGLCCRARGQHPPVLGAVRHISFKKAHMDGN